MVILVVLVAEPIEYAFSLGAVVVKGTLRRVGSLGISLLLDIVVYFLVSSGGLIETKGILLSFFTSI